MAPKNPAAVALGRRGGKATAQNRTPDERAAAARKAVEARWARQKAELKELVAEIDSGTKALLDKTQKREAELKKNKARQKRRT